MINVHGIRRNVKNVVRNYTEPQIKVREATSNDPWGPSSTLMSEIADLTYNVVAFSEIMQMIWKRLNDHGKNWRHVYKALVLLEYLIKTGSEKVTQQCKENIFAIQTLKDFQHIEDNKDQGMNVREKSKQLVSLLKDEERLKNERARALKAKERFAQASSHVGSDTVEKLGSPGYSDSHGSSPDGASLPRAGALPSELECARPQTAGEEELQLQLALAMSKEEAEQEERLRRNDDLRLQLAITESQQEFHTGPETPGTTQQSAMNDLLGLSVSGATANHVENRNQATDPWGMPLAKQSEESDPWRSKDDESSRDPWRDPTTPPSGTISVTPTTQNPVQNDPWDGAAPNNDAWNGKQHSAAGTPGASINSITTNGEVDEFDVLHRRTTMNSPDLNDPFSVSSLKESLSTSSFHQSPSMQEVEVESNNSCDRKTPESFLGPNSSLVNLDALVSSQAAGHAPSANTNPFAPPVYNPFQATKPPPPTINQLRAQNEFPAFSSQSASQGATTLPEPLVPAGNLETTFISPTSPPVNNPFM